MMHRLHDFSKYVEQGGYSSGRGTIKGKYIESTYQSTLPSTGRCSGTLSLDGLQMTSVCVDSVNDKFDSAWVRQ